MRRIIEQRCGDDAYVGDFAPGADEPFEESVVQAGRTEPAIAAKVDAVATLATHLRSERATEIRDVLT